MYSLLFLCLIVGSNHSAGTANTDILTARKMPSVVSPGQLKSGSSQLIGTGFSVYQRVKELAASTNSVIILPPVRNAFGPRWKNLDRIAAYGTVDEESLLSHGLAFEKSDGIWYPTFGSGSVQWIPEITADEYRFYVNNLIDALRPIENSESNLRLSPDGTCTALKRVCSLLNLSSNMSSPIAFSSLSKSSQQSILNLIDDGDPRTILETAKSCERDISHVDDGQLGLDIQKPANLFGFGYKDQIEASSIVDPASTQGTSIAKYPIRRSVNVNDDELVRAEKASRSESVFTENEYTIESLAQIASKNESSPIEVNVTPCLRAKRVTVFGHLEGNESKVLASACEMYDLSLVKTATSLTIAPVKMQLAPGSNIGERVTCVRHFLPISAYKMLGLFDDDYLLPRSVLFKQVDDSVDDNTRRSNYSDWKQRTSSQINQLSEEAQNKIYEAFVQAKSKPQSTRIQTSSLPTSDNNWLSFFLIEPIVAYTTNDFADENFSLLNRSQNIYLQGNVQSKDGKLLVRLGFLEKAPNGKYYVRMSLDDFPVGTALAESSN